MTTEAEEVEELRGRLTAFMVNYPDVENRVHKTVTLLSELLEAVKTGRNCVGLMQAVVEDLETLRVQIAYVYEKFPELRKTLTPIMELLGKLLEPVEPTVH